MCVCPKKKNQLFWDNVSCLCLFQVESPLKSGSSPNFILQGRPSRSHLHFEDSFGHFLVAFSDASVTFSLLLCQTPFARLLLRQGLRVQGVLGLTIRKGSRCAWVRWMRSSLKTAPGDIQPNLGVLRLYILRGHPR